MRRIALVGLIGALIAVAASCVLPIQDLGGPTSWALGINDGGTIVGVSELPGSTPEHRLEHAFRRSPDGTIVDLGTLPGHDSSGATRVNPDGITIGQSASSAYDFATQSPAWAAPHAVRWAADGTITDLGTLGGPTSEARAINAAGVIVGNSDTSSGDTKAFVYDPAVGNAVQLTDLPGARQTLVFSLNDVGQAVGFQWDYSTPTAPLLRPVRWDVGTGAVTDLTPFFGSGPVYAINDAGAITGLVRTATGTSSTIGAAILLPGDTTPTPMGLDGFAFSVAINEDNAVVGWSTNGSDGTRAFRWEEATGVVWLDPDHPSEAWDINESGQMVGRSADKAAIFAVPPAAP